MVNYNYSKRKLNYFFNKYSLLLLFILTTLIVGVIAGSISVKILSYQQKEDLINYLSKFTVEVEKLVTNQQLVIKDIIISNLKLVFVLWLLGLSIIGIIIIPIIVFLKGYILGFTVGFLVDEMFFKGILLSIIAVIPHNLVIIPALVLGSLFCLVYVLKLVRKFFSQRNYNNGLASMIINYSGLMLVVACLLILAALIEVYITPYLIKTFAKFLIP